MTEGRVEVVRVYEDTGRTSGDHRVLVDRLWPRGVTKEALDYDEWAKSVAPSSELRRWYGHDPDRFTEFSHRYRQRASRASGCRVSGPSSSDCCRWTARVAHCHP